MKAFVALFIASLAVAAQGSYLPALSTAVVADTGAVWPYSTAWSSLNGGWNTWNGLHQQASIAYPYAQSWSPAYGVYGHKTLIQANLGNQGAYSWGLPWGSYGVGYAGKYGWGKKGLY
ncbi:uncharacterized protein LOC134217802 [Armigeres subalbatus]|uniref:uncharacterized protein LOC134217802 n=1 Tax=Armigeres subalbatus TaxID=124917 RepID=UPI002ED0C0AD